MLWLILALVAAVATSLTTIFAKIGIKNVNSNFATMYRTGIVIICCIIMCLISGSINKISQLTFNNWIFLCLSGIATGCSWLCYYKALKLGNINKVAPIDKSSFILTSILFLIFFYNDTTNGGQIKVLFAIIIAMILMFCGTFLMINKTEDSSTKSRRWFVYAILSAIFASVVSLFVKIGLSGIPSDLGTLIRTIIVFIFSVLIVLARKEYKGVKMINKSSWIFLTCSGIAAGIAWLCEYYSLNINGVSPVAVNCIGKLSILLTMLFSYYILKERFTLKSLIGLTILTIGIIIIVMFSL